MSSVTTPTLNLAPPRSPARTLRRVLVWGVAFTPILFAAALVARYGVDVPRLDELEIGMILQTLRGDGHLTVGMLLHQSNESRLVFPKLISVGLAKLTNWDTRWAMWLTLALMLANLLMLHALYRRLQREINRVEATPVASAAVFFAMALIIFTPYQTELTWGFQYLTHIPMLCILAGALLALSSLPGWLKHPLAAILCIIATFSYANGMIAWGLVGGVFALTGQFGGRGRGDGRGSMDGRGRGVLWGLLWLALGAGAVWLYLHDYQKPAHHPSFMAFRGQEWAALRGFLSFLGAPLALELYTHGEQVALPTAAAAGAVALGIWAAFLGTLAWRYRWEALRQAAPWLALVGYGVGSGLVTTLGRLGFGPGAMMSTRYAGFSTYILAGTIAIAAVALHGAFAGRVRIWLLRGVAVVVGVGAVYLYAAGLEQHLQKIAEIHRGCMYIRAALPYAEQMKPLPVVDGFFPNPNMAKASRRWRRMGYFRPAAVATDVYERATAQGYLGAVDGLKRSGDEYTASGWAALPKPMRAADAVLITMRAPGASTRLPVAIARPEHPRPDVVKATHRDATLWSGWQVTFAAPMPALAPAASSAAGPDPDIEAWAIDARDGSLHPIRPPAPAHAPAHASAPAQAPVPATQP